MTGPPHPLTVVEAYDIQREAAARRVAQGDSIAGYKIGCISPAVQKQLGISLPVFGHIFGSELHRSGVRLDVRAFEELGIEGEIAVRLGPEGEIAAAFPVIELHHMAWRGSGTAAELIAANAMQAGVVLPEKQTGWSVAPLSVWRNGAELGSTGDVDLPAMVRLVAAHAGALAPGTLVLTGSRLPLYAARAGDRFEVRVAGAPAVSLIL